MKRVSGLTNIVCKLVKLITTSLIIFILVDFILVDSASANSILAGFGAETKIATPSGNIAVENLRIGDRVIGYNFETHRHRENIVKKIKQRSALGYYLNK